MEHWNVLLASHVIAALFVLAVGPLQIFRHRRDRVHRTVGYFWIAAMYYVCLSSFWITSDGRFSWLHGLSAFTLMTVTLGLISAVRGNINAHRGNMAGSYLGTVIAFGFAVAVPGRAIPGLLASDPGSAVFVTGLVAAAVAVVYVSLLRGEKNGKARRRPAATAGLAPAGRARPAKG